MRARTALFLHSLPVSVLPVLPVSVLLVLGLLVMGLGAGTPAWAGDPPTRSHVSSDGAFRLDVYEGRQGVRIVINNLEAFPITAKLTIGELENLAADQALPRVVIIPAKGKSRLVRLTQRDTTQSWRYGKVHCTYQIGSIKTRPKPHDYQLPFPPGAAYRLDQGFNGAFSHKGKNALDFGLGEGELVTAARSGRVVKVTSQHKAGGTEPRFRGKANRIWILHSDGTFGCYAHFKHGGVSVKVGQDVRVGEAIGRAGATGFAQGVHLHFEVRYAREGRTQAATVPITFATQDGTRQELVVGKTYQRAGKAKGGPKLLKRVELCRAPSRASPALTSAPVGVKLWARLVIGVRSDAKLRLLLRREGPKEAVVWKESISLKKSADRALQALPASLEPGRYELFVHRGQDRVGRLTFTIE
ncbi:MAG: M23 family metallopeptidase [Planctomycetes bacterium]|nr:M23 family metallopeptidase [Planctomycetota bacterium]